MKDLFENGRVNLFGVPSVPTTYVLFSPTERAVACGSITDGDSLFGRLHPSGGVYADRKPQIIRIDDSGDEPTRREA